MQKRLNPLNDRIKPFFILESLKSYKLNHSLPFDLKDILKNFLKEQQDSLSSLFL